MKNIAREVLRLCAVTVAAVVLGGVALWMKAELTIPPVVRTFPAKGIHQVILLAKGARSANVSYLPVGKIQISGQPDGEDLGGNNGNPKPTKLRDVPFDFVAQGQGMTLVISAKSEWTGFHSNFWLKDIELKVPYGTSVKKVEVH